MPFPFTPRARWLAGRGAGAHALSRSCPRPAATLLWSALAVLVPCGLTAALARAPGFWAAPGPHGADTTAAAEGPDVVDVCQDLVRRHAAKRRLAGEVIAGRLSLLEAVARFRYLDEQPPAAGVQALRMTYPGASDDECRCRAVITVCRRGLAGPAGCGPRRDQAAGDGAAGSSGAGGPLPARVGRRLPGGG